MREFYFESLVVNYKRIKKISTPAESKAWLNEIKKDACKKFYISSGNFTKCLKKQC